MSILNVNGTVTELVFFRVMPESRSLVQKGQSVRAQSLIQSDTRVRVYHVCRRIDTTGFH